jgi:hypothetical protein
VVDENMNHDALLSTSHRAPIRKKMQGRGSQGMGETLDEGWEAVRRHERGRLFG